MSGVLKAVGKAFKAVTRVVKKIALPALAIGAVVLTGGAALGVLPSIGALGSSLGLSAGLTGILSTAAQGATFGALGSLLTGKNPIKGATAGLLAGGVMGGIGALGAGAGGPMSAAQTVQSGGGAAAGGTAASAAEAMRAGAQAIGVNSAAAGLGGGGIGSAVSPAVAAITPAAAQGIAQAPQVAQLATSGGGLLGFLNRNPAIAGMAMQGIGSGLSAASAAKEAQKERERIAANYADMSGLFQAPTGFAANGQPAAERYDGAVYSKVKYDPSTGRVVAGA